MYCDNCKKELSREEATIIGGKERTKEIEETFRFISQNYSVKEVLKILGIGYEHLSKLKTEFERDLELQLVISLQSNLVSRDTGEPLILINLFDYLRLPYKSERSFKMLLNKNKVPVKHITLLLDCFENDFIPALYE